MKRYYYLLKGMGVFSRKATTGVNSEALFRSIEEQATQEVWWQALGLPKNWITEHSLLALHVWIFHNRFKVRHCPPLAMHPSHAVGCSRGEGPLPVLTMQPRWSPHRGCCRWTTTWAACSTAAACRSSCLSGSGRTPRIACGMQG